METVDTYDFLVIPPWLIRTWARVNLCNELVAETGDLEDIDNLMSYEHESNGILENQITPPDEVIAFFNDPRRQYGIDQRMIFLRNEGLVCIRIDLKLVHGICYFYL